MDNDELNYWEIIENNCGFELSKDFKELYFKMDQKFKKLWNIHGSNQLEK